MPLSVSSLLLISAISVLFKQDIPIVPESLKHSYVACADSCRLEEDDKKPAAMLGRSGNGRPASATITVPGQGSGAATGDFAAAASAASARDTLSPKAEGASQVRARCSPEVFAPHRKRTRYVRIQSGFPFFHQTCHNKTTQG